MTEEKVCGRQIGVWWLDFFVTEWQCCGFNCAMKIFEIIRYLKKVFKESLEIDYEFVMRIVEKFCQNLNKTKKFLLEN